MADTVVAFPKYGVSGGQVVPIKAVDNGDGTYSLSVSGGSAPTGAVPKFLARLTAGLNSIPDSTPTKCPFTVVELDTIDGSNVTTAGLYDGTMSRWTPGRAGFYEISINLRMFANTATWYASLALNGSIVRNLFQTSTTAGQFTLGATILIYLGDTDYLEAFINQNSGTDAIIYGTTIDSFWFGRRVG